MNIEKAQRVNEILERHGDYHFRIEVLYDLITGTKRIIDTYAVDTEKDTYFDGERWRKGFVNYAEMIHDWNLENERIGHRRIVT